MDNRTWSASCSAEDCCISSHWDNPSNCIQKQDQVCQQQECHRSIEVGKSCIWFCKKKTPTNLYLKNCLQRLFKTLHKISTLHAQNMINFILYVDGMKNFVFQKFRNNFFFISYIYCMQISVIALLMLKWNDYWISCQGSQTLAPKSATVHSKAIIYLFGKVIKPAVTFLSSSYHCIVRCYVSAHVQIFIFQSTLSIMLTIFIFVMRLLRLQ